MAQSSFKASPARARSLPLVWKLTMLQIMTLLKLNVPRKIKIPMRNPVKSVRNSVWARAGTEKELTPRHIRAARLQRTS